MFEGVVQEGFVHGYERAGILAPDEVLYDLGRFDKNFFGRPVQMSDSRYRVFKAALGCARCGVVGAFFAVERSAKRISKQPEVWRACPNNKWHLNLYGLRADGTEVLMTKDHIKPRSLGGENADDNYQTMCAPCNVKKASKYVEPVNA